MKKLISIITPAFNEAENIDKYYAEVNKVIEKLKEKYDFEVLIISDGSTDQTVGNVEKLVKKDKRYHLIEFSRNFGKEIATSAGYMNCRGDAAIILDADLQFPQEMIPKFIEKWEKGNDVVVGVRKNNRGNFISKMGSKLFYYILNRISDTKSVPGSTDFRLIDRKVIDQLNKFTERNRITRGLIDWMGFNRDYILFEARERVGGRPSYNLIKKVRLAISSFVGLSLFPLKIAGYLGIFIMIVSTLMLAAIFIGRYILHNPYISSVTGTAILAIILMFFVGVILSCLGLISLYIATIYNEVTNRPLYIIKRII